MKSVIDILFLRRHFWHRVKLNELSELYISLTLRTLGLGMIGIFIPVYFYQQGYSLETIALLFAAYYLARLVIDPFIGMLIAKFGPKHVIRASFLVETIFLVSIIAAGNFLIPIWFTVITFSTAVSMFMLAFHVDFSTVESIKHAGRQLGVLTILEKAASAAGPLAGGLIATFYGFEIAVLAALTVTLVAAIPLYATAEARNHRAYQYKFSIGSYSAASNAAPVYAGRAFDIAANSLFWPIFAVIAVFSSQVYAGLGLITALGMAATMIFAHVIGKLVDNKKGRELLRFGAWSSALINMLRPVIRTIAGAIGINIAGESLNTAYRLPYMKGFYAEADASKFGRVAYIIGSLAIFHVVRAFMFALLALLLMFYGEVTALSVVMIVSGFGTLLILREKFSVLDN